MERNIQLEQKIEKLNVDNLVKKEIKVDIQKLGNSSNSIRLNQYTDLNSVNIAGHMLASIKMNNQIAIQPMNEYGLILRQCEKCKNIEDNPLKPQVSLIDKFRICSSCKRFLCDHCWPNNLLYNEPSTFLGINHNSEKKCPDCLEK